MLMNLPIEMLNFAGFYVDNWHLITTEFNTSLNDCEDDVLNFGIYNIYAAKQALAPCTNNKIMKKE